MGRTRYSGRNKTGKEQKYYAVSRGRKIGIFSNWNEASKSVTSYPKATHKSYLTLEEAHNAMAQAGIPNPSLFENVETGGEEENNNNKNSEETLVKEFVGSVQNNEEVEKETASSFGNQGLEVEKEHPMTSEKDRSLTCTDCKTKVAWRDTKLPVYQICLFVRKQRKFTCETCAQDDLDEKIFEDVHALMPETTSGVHDNEGELPDDRERQTLRNSVELLIAETSDTKGMVQLLESAITNLAERLEKSEMKTREDMHELHRTMTTTREKERETEQKKNVMQASFSEILKTPTSDKNIPNTSTSKVKQSSVEVVSRRKREQTSTKKITRDSDVKQASTPNESSDVKELEMTSRSRKKKKKIAERNSSFQNSLSLPFSVTETETSSSEEEEKEEDEGDSELPSVIIIHDSILKDIDYERLGKQHGMRVNGKKAGNIEEAEIEMKNTRQKPEAFVFHTGLNDIRINSGQKAAAKMQKLIKNTKDTFPSSKIVISKVAPTSKEELNSKRDVLNAIIFAEYQEDKNVSFVSYEDLYAFSRDGVHPALKGTGHLAKTLGNHLEGLPLGEKWRFVSYKTTQNPNKTSSFNGFITFWCSRQRQILIGFC